MEGINQIRQLRQLRQEVPLTIYTWETECRCLSYPSYPSFLAKKFAQSTFPLEIEV